MIRSCRVALEQREPEVHLARVWAGYHLPVHAPAEVFADLAYVFSSARLEIPTGAAVRTSDDGYDVCLGVRLRLLPCVEGALTAHYSRSFENSDTSTTYGAGVRIGAGDHWQVTADIDGNSDVETVLVGLRYRLDGWERSR